MFGCNHSPPAPSNNFPCGLTTNLRLFLSLQKPTKFNILLPINCTEPHIPPEYIYTRTIPYTPWKVNLDKMDMWSAEIQPMTVPNQVGSRQRDNLLVHHPGEDESNGSPGFGCYGTDQLPRGQEYWQARRAFLSSYHFSDDQSRLTGRLKRSVKGVNRAAMGVVLDVRQELSKRRFVIRVFRVRFTFPSVVQIRMRCFVPSLKKAEKLGR